MRIVGKAGGTWSQFRGAWLTTPFDGTFPAPTVALQPAICYRPGMVDKADTKYAVSPDTADQTRANLDYCREF